MQHHEVPCFWSSKEAWPVEAIASDRIAFAVHGWYFCGEGQDMQPAAHDFLNLFCDRMLPIGKVRGQCAAATIEIGAANLEPTSTPVGVSVGLPGHISKNRAAGKSQ